MEDKEAAYDVASPKNGATRRRRRRKAAPQKDALPDEEDEDAGSGVLADSKADKDSCSEISPGPKFTF